MFEPKAKLNPVYAKSNPDILRVTHFVLERAKQKQSFSVLEASKSPELNGIGEYRLAEILKSICLEPNGPGSLKQLTTIDKENSHALSGRWSLTAEAYFSYLSYESFNQAKAAQRTSTYSMWVAVIALSWALYPAFSSFVINLLSLGN